MMAKGMRVCRTWQDLLRDDSLGKHFVRHSHLKVQVQSFNFLFQLLVPEPLKIKPYQVKSRLRYTSYHQFAYVNYSNLVLCGKLLINLQHFSFQTLLAVVMH